MKEDFVSFELAKKLKENGFPMEIVPIDDCSDKPNPILFALPCDHPEWQYCDAWYIPTISQVLKWLREEKKIHIVCPFYKDKGFYYYVQRIGNAARIVSSFGDSDDCFDTHEQAALAGIEYVLDNLI